MRLIDADALKAKICDMQNDDMFHYNVLNEMFREVNLASTIDAVEVVRCGECKHLTADGRCLEFADDNLRPSASDFCSYGEKRK